MKNTDQLQYNLDETYWSNRYINKTDGWDIGYISPPLKNYFDQLTNKSISILIPGCGNAYEAIYLLENSFTNVTVVDLSSIPLHNLKNNLKKYYGNELTLIHGDFFDLTISYDLIIEQTFFCALNPEIRELYVKKMYDLLNTNGKLVGLLFNRTFESGPPFGGNIDLYKKLFNPFFLIKKIELCYNSIKERNETEAFFIFQKLIKNIQ